MIFVSGISVTSESIFWRIGVWNAGSWTLHVADIRWKCVKDPFLLSHGLTEISTLQWRHNERDSVSNHRPQDCLLNRLFRRRSKKTPKLRVTGLCAGNSPVTGEFPAQMASNAENVSIDDVMMSKDKNYIHYHMRDVITQSIPNFNSGLFKSRANFSKFHGIPWNSMELWWKFDI